MTRDRRTRQLEQHLLHQRVLTLDSTPEKIIFFIPPKRPINEKESDTSSETLSTIDSGVKKR